MTSAYTVFNNLFPIPWNTLNLVIVEKCPFCSLIDFTFDAMIVFMIGSYESNFSLYGSGVTNIMISRKGN